MDDFIKEKISSFLNVNKDEVLVITRLLGGMSNKMYVVEVNKEKYTFRIPGKNANVFVNRNIELENIKIVENMDLNCDTIYFDKTYGYKISKYIEGDCLVDLNSNDYLIQVSEILKKLHNSKLKAVNDYDWLQRLSKYERLVFDLDYNVSRKKYFGLKNTLITKFDYFYKAELTICHGDSQISNFVVSKDKVYLLDWEFCANNDPFYDIACFGNKNFNDALNLLKVYLGKEPTKEQIKKLNFYRGFQCLQWHNVALYKHLIGLSEELNVPFLDVSDIYLEKGKEFLNNAI